MSNNITGCGGGRSPEIWSHHFDVMTSKELSGVYAAEIKDNLGKSEVVRKPSGVIVSGNALFYFKTYRQEENSSEI